MKPETNRPIAVEDLLRLKRAERPPAEFWGEFDRQLRAKQLAALVGRRPWWQTLPQMFSRLGRYQVPIGGAAILAITFISVREFQGGRSVHPAPVTPGAVASNAIPATPESRLPAVSAVVEPLAGSVAVEASGRREDASPAAAVASQPANAGQVVPLLGAPPIELTAASAVTAPLATNLSALPAMTENLPRALLTSTATVFETRGSTRGPVEPLQQITPPGERRRSNLLTAMVSLSSNGAPVRTLDRVSDRISEDRLYDQIHRFGARGAGVSMKF
jgi:hypothetical protein